MVTQLHNTEFDMLCKHLSASQVQQIKGLLDKGETVYWAACPQSWRFVMGRYAAGRTGSMGFFVMGLVFIALGAAALLMQSGFSSLILVFLGLVLCGGLAAEMYMARQRIYAVSDRRAMAISLSRMEVISSIGLDVLETAMDRHESDSPHNIPEIDFFGIDEAGRVRNLIREIIEARRLEHEQAELIHS